MFRDIYLMKKGKIVERILICRMAKLLTSPTLLFEGFIKPGDGVFEPLHQRNDFPRIATRDASTI